MTKIQACRFPQGVFPTALLCSVRGLERITEFLSRIKYGNRGIFFYMAFSVVDQSFQKKKTPDFFQTRLIWVGPG